MNRRMVRHGLVLILLALISGFFVSATAIPRLALSAHTIGVLGGALLIALGAIWRHFSLSPLQGQVMTWTWLYSSYINWLACLAGAVLGAGRMTPIAAAGVAASELSEGIVSFLFASVAVTSLVAVGLSLWGLRPHGRNAT